jgi:hypothetical protein
MRQRPDVPEHGHAERRRDPLEGAIEVLSRAQDQGVPVLAAGSREVAGWLTHRDLLEACRTALALGDGGPSWSLAEREAPAQVPVPER